MASDPISSDFGGEVPQEAGIVPQADPVVPPSQRIAVVVNGNAKSVNDEVIDTLDQILTAGELFVSRRVEEGRYGSRPIESDEDIARRDQPIHPNSRHRE